MSQIKQVKFPSFFNKYDVYFLSRKLNLTKGKTTSLIEQERDFYLIIQQICSLPLTKKQTKNLSDEFLITLLIFRYGKRKKTNVQHLTQLSKLTIESYSMITRGKVFLKHLDKSKPSKQHSSLILVMFGLFSDYFTDDIDAKKIKEAFKENVNFIIEGFSSLDVENLPEMVLSGMEILSEIKEKEWIKETINLD
jgi:hypothetical protein